MPSATTSAPTPAPTAAPSACRAPGAYLTAIRAGQDSGYDRVVFEFSGGLPRYRAGYVTTVLQDPKGTLCVPRIASTALTSRVARPALRPS